MIMSVKVLQINFKFNIPSADLKNGLAPFVKDIAAVSGLRWKVWIMNEQENEAGGIYLFDDEDSFQAYLGGPIIAGLKSNPALSDISAKVFDVVEDFTAETRGPIK
jgi:hypothetical protein